MKFRRSQKTTAGGYNEVLNLSRQVDPPHDHFASLETELRISRASFDPARGILEVNGWCLSPEPSFDLMLEIEGTGLVEEITPNSEERQDVFGNYPHYGNRNSGWRIQIPVSDLPAQTTVRAVYASSSRIRMFQAPVRHPANASGLQETIRLRKCSYSPLRSLCVIEGTIISPRDDLDFKVTLSSGVTPDPLHLRVTDTNEKGHRNWTLNFPLTGLHDNEEAIITEAANPQTPLVVPINTERDSSRRIIATQPSVLTTLKHPEDGLTLDDIAALRQSFAAPVPSSGKERGEICYFPAFDDTEKLADHYHRASWYLTGWDSPITRVTLAGPASRKDLPPPADYFTGTALEEDTLTLLEPGDAYMEALGRAGTILVWRPLPKGLQNYLSRMSGAEVITVATHDPTAVEYGNYCRSPWMLLPPEKKEALLTESQERFRHVLREQRDAGKTCSAVFGTGPSIDTAFDFDFGNCMSVACNSIVANDALMDHIRPAFICAGDAVSHFGVSSYAETFRNDLIRALSTRDIYFFTSAPVGFLLIQKHPEIRDRVILCEQKFSGLNADLEHVWALPRFDSTLNIHMLPIAASFADTVYMLGLDGRAPDPAENEDFWAHSKAAQYHDLVDTGHLAHPSFTINRAKATEDRYLASVAESLLSGEAIGKSFFSLASSHTPPVHARPAPPRCFGPGTKPRKLLPPRPAPREKTGKRALIVTQITRRYFSGGRYHGTMMAEALASFCDEVVVWSNNIPPWSGDLAYCPDHDRVHYWVDNFVQPPEGDFDYVIVLPDGARDPEMYYRAYEKARASNARTVFLNFESPNWFNALSPAPKNLQDSDNWFAAACFSDIVLSSAETARPFAESFYQTLFHTPIFAVAPPAINSPIADLVRTAPPAREKQITLISRFKNSSAHKNIGAIFDIITPEMQGYTLALIAGTSELPDEASLAQFRTRLEGQGLKLKLLYMISDRQKFEEIARSELMIFPSLFEGFGYPPVEAGYMNTPCVAYDLPVLQEFNGDHTHFVPWGNAQALREKIAELLCLPPEKRVRTPDPRVRETATLEAFRQSLQAALEQAEDRPFAAAKFSPDMFEIARRTYVDGCGLTQTSFGAVEDTGDFVKLAERYMSYAHAAEAAMEALRARSAPNKDRMGRED